MKKAIFAIVVILFAVCLILTIGARTAYPKPIYEPIYHGDPRYTGQVIEYIDRASGWEVQWVLVYDPDNPGWVEFFQGDTGILIPLVLFLIILWSYPKKSYHT